MDKKGMTIEFWKKVPAWGLLVLCTLLFGGATYYSLRYSMQFMDVFNESLIGEPKDSLLLHFVVAICFLGILFVADGLLKKCVDVEKSLNRFLYIVMAVALIGSLIWVLNGNFYAQNDSRSILECIGRIRNGDFSDLTPAGYLGAYQNQLGIALIFQFLFFFFRTSDDIVIQIVNALCVPCIIFAGNGFLKELNCRKICYICYLIGMLFCFPLLFYTPYVYGEMISVTAGCFFIWAAVCYIKRGKLTAWISLMLSAVIGNLARGNFPVLLIAFGIMAVLYGIRKKTIMLVICAATLVFVTVMGLRACHAYYERISGIKLDQGIPIEGWVAMGLNDNAPAYGMYNGYNVNIYAKHDYNREAAKEECLAFIHDRLYMMSGGGWIPFFKEKILVQWNDPTLNCFMENRTFIPEPRIPAIKEIMLDVGKYYQTAIEWMNQYQFLLYFGALFYCITAFKRKKPFYELLPLIIIFGGFLFTLIWEAMARYVFPYVIYMVPIAAMGWCEMEELMKKIWLRKNKMGAMDAGEEKDMPDSSL